MKRIFVLLLLILAGSKVFALSFGATNPGAVNMARYYQNSYNYRRPTQNTLPYVYSEQQAKYYGINVNTPNSQYRNYGLYKQNYTNSNSGYTQKYRY